MTCKDCVWFGRSMGRAQKSCQDLGETEDNNACPSFLNVPARVASLGQEHYRDVFHEIISEQFVLEQDLSVAVDTVKAQLQAQGALITMEDGFIKRASSKLIDTVIMYRLSLAVGLGRFVDQIMSHHIDSTFGDSK